MYYEITIVKDGKHFFATSDRSITTSRELSDVLDVFKEKFPEYEGYKMLVTKVEQISFDLTRELL